MFRNRNELDNHIYEIFESNFYTSNTKDKAENYKESRPYHKEKYET